MASTIWSLIQLPSVWGVFSSLLLLLRPWGFISLFARLSGVITFPLGGFLTLAGSSMSWLLKPLGVALVSALVMGVTFGMGDWHGRSIQKAKDDAFLNAAIDAKNKEIVADNKRIDQANAEAEAALARTSNVVINRPVPVITAASPGDCKVSAELANELNAIH